MTDEWWRAGDVAAEAAWEELRELEAQRHACDSVADPDVPLERGGRGRGRPRVVALCGSMRHAEEIREAAVGETLAGRIVVMPHVDLNRTDRAEWVWLSDRVQVKARLDELHQRKIDLADEVVIVCPGGYMGDSTGGELTYAVWTGKPVRFRGPKPEGVTL